MNLNDPNSFYSQVSPNLPIRLIRLTCTCCQIFIIRQIRQIRAMRQIRPITNSPNSANSHDPQSSFNLFNSPKSRNSPNSPNSCDLPKSPIRAVMPNLPNLPSSRQKDQSPDGYAPKTTFRWPAKCALPYQRTLRPPEKNAPHPDLVEKNQPSLLMPASASKRSITASRLDERISESSSALKLRT